MTISFCVSCVKELMTPQPLMINPGATLQQAAKNMEAIGCGVLPVGSEDKLQGIITDRDIVVRAIAQGKDPAVEKVGDYMTSDVYTCKESASLEEAAEKMHLYKVGRLVIKNNDDIVTGILSFGSIIRHDAKPEEIVEIIKHAAGPVSVH